MRIIWTRCVKNLDFKEHFVRLVLVMKSDQWRRLWVEYFSKLSTKRTVSINNKNAFQWDAYRPLVDRIAACTVAGGYTCPGGTCPGGGGIPAQWVPAQGGVNAWGCTCLGGVPVWRSVPAWGGYLPWFSPLWTDRHLWKHNLHKLCLWAVTRKHSSRMHTTHLHQP